MREIDVDQLEELMAEVRRWWTSASRWSSPRRTSRAPC